jgi:ABC-type lipoprotein export system ATPase subunit
VAGAYVSVEHVYRCFGQTTIINDVSLVVEAGESVGLTGASGSGKTTLLQMIGSLDPPTRGRIRVDNVDLSNLSHPARFRRDTVGFVFQLHHLLPELTAQQNVELPLLAAGTSRRERGARTAEVLSEVGLPDRLHSLPADLSGGERQRVAIARALAARPKLILADEPTGALDSRSSVHIWKLLAQVNEQHGTTMIIASHDPAVVERTDRPVNIVDGRLGPPLDPANLKEATI